MEKTAKVALGTLGIGALLLVGPLLLPVPKARGTRPAQALATSDSQFVRVNNLDIHLNSRGHGEPAIILMHGFGASVFSWRKVIEPLSQHARVVAYDRPGFGLTSRPMPGDWAPDEPNPYGYQAQAESLIALLDTLEIREAILVAHSAGASIAGPVALQHPQRIRALVLVDPYLNTHGGFGWAQKILLSPQMRRIGPLLVRLVPTMGHRFLDRAWHDTSAVDSEMLSGYGAFTKVDNWDRALWEYIAATESIDIEGRLDGLTQPTLIVSGQEDEMVPVALSQELANELPRARLVMLPNCGHVPPEECPVAFLTAMEAFLEELEP